MAIKSTDLPLEFIRQLEEKCDTLSIALEGKVYMIQSKDGEELLKDEMDGKIVVQLIKNAIEFGCSFIESTVFTPDEEEEDDPEQCPVHPDCAD